MVHAHGARLIGTATFAALAGGFFAAGIAVAFARPGWLVDHPRVALAVVAAISVGAVAGLIRLDPPRFRLTIDPASEPLIGRDDPGRPVYRQATRDFGSDDVYVIAMETDNVFTHENLTVLRELNRKLRGLPGIASVESLARALAVRWDPEHELVSVDRFMREVPTDGTALAVLRQRALDDPIYRKTLISADGRTAAIDITFQPMSDGEFVALDLDGRIEALLREYGGAGRHFYIAGRPHVRAKAHHIIVRDLALLVPVAVAVAAFALWLMSGSLWGVSISLVACLLATLWVYGAMALLQIDINLITLVLGPIMICVGSVYGVHVYARYQLIAADCENPRSAAFESLIYARTPVTMAGVTTCIGFGALLLTDVPATNQLGAFAIVGVAGVTTISLSAVPAALRLLPATAAHGGGSPVSDWFGARLETLLDRVGRLVVCRPTGVLATWAVLLACAVAAIPHVSIDTDFITFFRERSIVRTDFDAVNRLLAGAVPIYVTLAAEKEGAFREPATLEGVARLQAQLEALPGVKEVLASVDLIRNANRAMHGGVDSEARIPESRRAVAEATFLLPKDKFRPYANSNHSRSNLIVRSGELGSAAMRSLETRIHSVLASAELPKGITSAVTGNAILINRSADGIAGNQATQVGLAATAILLLIVAVFRSLRLGLLAMVPNVVPVVIFFGILGAGAAPLSIPTSLIGSIALGIAIDDTMHFLVAYQKQRRSGLDPSQSVQRTIQQVGRPIVMTSVMLVVGFLVILASGFATLQEFGVLTALTMAICLSTDLLLLPALLVRLRA